MPFRTIFIIKLDLLGILQLLCIFYASPWYRSNCYLIIPIMNAYEEAYVHISIQLQNRVPFDEYGYIYVSQ